MREMISSSNFSSFHKLYHATHDIVKIPLIGFNSLEKGPVGTGGLGGGGSGAPSIIVKQPKQRCTGRDCYFLPKFTLPSAPKLYKEVSSTLNWTSRTSEEWACHPTRQSQVRISRRQTYAITSNTFKSS